MKRILFSLICVCAVSALSAQLSPYYSFQTIYHEAEDLFRKGLYGPAMLKLEMLQEAEADTRDPAYNDLHTKAEYMQAVCAYQLERDDAVARLEGFIFHYPENTHTPQANYYLGKYYLDRRDYRDAIGPLEEAYRAGSLTQEKFDEVVFFLGYSYFQEERTEQATRFFDLASRRNNPYQEDAAYYKSVLLYKEKDYERAYDAFQELRDSRKYGQEIRVYLANTLLKLKKYDELYVLADELIQSRLSDDDAQVFYIVANASFERDDYRRTSEYFERYTQARGRMNATDNFRFGYAYYKQQQYAKAIPVLERALNNTDSLAQVASYYLGFSFLEENDQASAKFAFQKASESRANSTITREALYQYGKVAFATRSYNEALTAFQQLKRSFPNAPFINEVDGLIGEVLLTNKDYPRAIRYLESVPRTSPRARKAYQTVCYFYALGLYERGGFEPAIPYLQKAIENNFDPDMALSARFWLGEAQFRLENFEAAKTAYQGFASTRGATNNEFYARASYGMAWCDFKKKNYSAALQNFETYIGRSGRNADRDLYLDAHLRAADCLFLMRDYTKSIRYYRQVLDFRYTYMDYAAYQVAEAQYRLNNYSESVQTYDRMISSFRDSELRDDALDRISEIYMDWIKDYSAASRYARMLVEEYPRSPLAPAGYNRLALAAYLSNNESSAITYFKKVVEDYPQDKKNAQIALDNLAALLPEREFDRIFQQYRNTNPTMDEGLANLAFKTGQDRFFANNFRSAIDQFTTYINEFRNGPNYHEALVFRARSYRELGQMSEALADYEMVYSTPTSTPFTNVALQEAAEIRYEQQEFMVSLQLYQTLDEVSGSLQNKVAAKFGIAKNYQSMKDHVAAINVLEQIYNNAEVAVYSRTKAQVEIGQNQYLAGQLDRALTTFREVEREFKNQFGAQSQLMVATILYDQGMVLKSQGQALDRQGNTTAADEKSREARDKFEAVKQAVIYQSNNYPTFNYEKARAFLVAAEAFYELGNTFQAKGTLESLTAEDRFPDVQTAARERLAEIEAEENARFNP